MQTVRQSRVKTRTGVMEAGRIGVGDKQGSREVEQETQSGQSRVLIEESVQELGKGRVENSKNLYTSCQFPRKPLVKC